MSSFYSSIDYFFISTTRFLLIFKIIDHFSIEYYGIWVLIFGFCTFIESINIIGNENIAKHLIQNVSLKEKYFLNGFILSILLPLLILPIAYFLFWTYLNYSLEDRELLILSITLLKISFFYTLSISIINFFSFSLDGLNKVKIRVILNTFNNVLIILYILTFFDKISLQNFFTIISINNYIFIFIFFLALKSNFEFKKFNFDKDIIKDLIIYGYKNFIFNIIRFNIEFIIKLIINIFYPIIYLSILDLLLKMGLLIQNLGYYFLRPIFVDFSSKYRSIKKIEISKNYLLYASIIMIIPIFLINVLRPLNLYFQYEIYEFLLFSLPFLFLNGFVMFFNQYYFAYFQSMSQFKILYINISVYLIGSLLVLLFGILVQLKLFFFFFFINGVTLLFLQNKNYKILSKEILIKVIILLSIFTFIYFLLINYLNTNL